MAERDSRETARGDEASQEMKIIGDAAYSPIKTKNDRLKDGSAHSGQEKARGLRELRFAIKWWHGRG